MKVVVFQKLDEVKFIVIAKDMTEAREMVERETGMTKNDFTIITQWSTENKHIMSF